MPVSPAGSLEAVISACVAGANIKDLCAKGDSTIVELVNDVYKKDAVKKGIAFPTTVSPRHFACHLSPLSADPEAKIELADGDVVRIELGVHVDGYIAQAGKTIVVGSGPVTGKKADVIKAAHTCLEAALRTIQPGGNSDDFIKRVAEITADFGVKAVEGMLSQQLLRNVLDGPKQIHQAPPADQKPEKVQFEQGEVYTISLLLSTSAEAKTKPTEGRTTIFKRNPDAVYSLKMKSSRAIFSQVKKDVGTMAFHLGSFEDEKKARMGIIECNTHGLVTPYQVLAESEEGAELASLVISVLLLPAGPLPLTPLVQKSDARISSEKSLSGADLKALLETPLKVATAKPAK
ncbi:Proliferation-associated protein 2G4 [Kappamyces sp. JEL0829]|nr:Proliferation-associated protein 2G4 [Kappamyces sp. JEL0829]